MQDCPKAHVSKAQKTHPPSAISAGTSAITPARPSATASSAESNGAAIAGAGEKPCKFGAACTRPNCVFVHPWDVRGDSSAQVKCRYGAACTRADCHFKHPAHRPAPYGAGGAGGNRGKYSAKFAGAAPAASPAKTSATGKSSTTEGTIAPRPDESAEHVSERLKRFAGPTSDGEPVERILPGQKAESSGVAKEGESSAGDKVEIHLDDEDEKKDKVVAGVKA